MSINIPVSAEFDGSKVEAQLQAFRQQLNALGSQIAQANKVQFNPVGKSGVEDMRKMIAQFEALKRVSGDMNKRINATGQKGAGFFDLDWAKMYPDQHSRNRQMAKSFQYVTGSAFGGGLSPMPGGKPPAAPSGPQSPQRPSGGGAGGFIGGIAQAGLRAAGPAGGVAAGAMGTGMSAGFGAGMMGLLGGIGALAVGKVVGAITEKMGQAEDNLVAFDKLKRVLGDVSVSFVGLKTVLEGTAKGVGIKLGDAGQLASQFAKAGNLSGDQYGSLGGELRTGVGMSRSLGLDPSQGIGFLGSMRGMKATQDEQGSRKMALLVGETIAKSGAFAKADEVMGAISGYVTSQTRASFGANASGFAGMLSSMVGSGIPGMDVAGSAGLLGKINSNLAAGGAKGEASQMFTAMVGQSMGLDAYQTKFLREGGAFATNDNTFGKGSIGEIAGISGPSGGGSKTFMQASIEKLKSQYGNNPAQLADATANHFGISMRQAAGYLALAPNEMGGLEDQLKRSGVDLKDINYAGLGSLSKISSGTAGDRKGIASELWSRGGDSKLSQDERSKLDKVMKTGTEQEQKDVLTSLVASRDQEMTQGKYIRDTLVSVDNIKTLLAEQLLPVTQAMRDGIILIAGGGKKSGRQVQLDLMAVEHNENNAGIYRNSAYGTLNDRREELKSRTDASEDAIRRTYRDKPELMQSKIEERNKNLEEMANIDSKLAAAKEEQERLIKEENDAYKERKAALDPKDNSYTPGSTAIPEGWNAKGDDGSSPKSRTTPIGNAPAGTGGGAASGAGPSGALSADALLEGSSPEVERMAQAIYLQESGGGRNTSTSHAGAAGHMQMMPDTFNQYADSGWDIRNPSHNRRAALRLIKDLNNKAKGNTRSVFGGYYGGSGAIRADGSLKTFRDKKNPSFPNTQEYADQVMKRMQNMPQGTPVPSTGTPKPDRDQRSFIFDAQPIEIIHKNERGEQIGQSSQLSTRIRPATPFGADRAIA